MSTVLQTLFNFTVAPLLFLEQRAHARTETRLRTHKHRRWLSHRKEREARLLLCPYLPQSQKKSGVLQMQQQNSVTLFFVGCRGAYQSLTKSLLAQLWAPIRIRATELDRDTDVQRTDGPPSCPPAENARKHLWLPEKSDHVNKN